MASSCASPNDTSGAKIGRPAQWTPSKSRKLARLYVYTVLPVEQIIKAVFRDDDQAVKYVQPPPPQKSIFNTQGRKNSAQKTMHKLFGPDPRSLRPADRDEQNTRFKVWRTWNERRRSSATTLDHDQPTPALKIEETTTPLPFSHPEPFGHVDALFTPHQDMHEKRFDVTSPTTTLISSPGAPIFSAFPKDDEGPVFQFPRRPLRVDTGCTASTQMSTNSVRSLRKLLGVSTFFAKQVGLIMRFTVGSTENLATLTAHRTPSDFPTIRRGHGAPVPHPGLAVPGDFMIAQKYVQSCQRERHFAQYLQESKCACWCTIADETTDLADNFYLTAKGDVCDRASIDLGDLANGPGVDVFGNTLAHLFAALETKEGIEATLHIVQSKRTSSFLANKADQTFLHVLSSVWFTGLNDLTAPLYTLLDELFYQGVSGAVFSRDVYGRTFFHQLDRYCSDVHAFNHIVRNYNGSVIPRDAFGVQPPSNLAEHTLPGLRRKGTAPLSPLAEELTDYDLAALHQSLITVVRAAYDDPSVEDDEGRNGLQCLAALKLDAGALSPSSPSSPNPNQPSNPNKRKRGKEDGVKTIETRAQYLENLLVRTASAKPPDVNHYDKRGMTVLMAFATYLVDEQDKSGLLIGKIIDTLLDAGAKLDARNRQGETALLVAARHGNKHVVSKLLDRGANFHARDKSGKGIMAIIESQITESSGDLPSYGRLEAVRAAVVAKKLGDTGGQDEPSFLDEWGWPLRSHV